MPTSTDHPASEQDAPRRGLFSARSSAIAIVVASIATLAVVFVMLTANSDAPLRVHAIPAQPDTTAQRTPAAPGPGSATPSPAEATPRPSAGAAGPTPSQTPAPAIDSRGFVDSAARCEAGERAAAIARTERAAVVICRDVDGSYEYQGVRLRDGAELRLADVRPLAVGFEARNGVTTYRLSPTELVVISGESLQSRDAILEYRTDEG
ncbi:hypothetical protein ACTWP6_28650 [Mycobacterium sp. 4D054]|uniref:hypothetical protein n=1 Tax=unclassified Mycobacterium TaxID=2642494 RepID=UPI0021B490AD|nr:hypothetical protein [Mycobacterium sp. SMC-8]UXA12271.1 hypothetical protein KXD97_31040 [Mycobacterium sp. SMC-8]